MSTNLSTQHALCLSIDIRHHKMERTGVLLLNVVEHINMPLIDIQVGIC